MFALPAVMVIQQFFYPKNLPVDKDVQYLISSSVCTRNVCIYHHSKSSHIPAAVIDQMLSQL